MPRYRGEHGQRHRGRDRRTGNDQEERSHSARGAGATRTRCAVRATSPFAGPDCRTSRQASTTRLKMASFDQRMGRGVVLRDEDMSREDRPFHRNLGLAERRLVACGGAFSGTATGFGFCVRACRRTIGRNHDEQAAAWLCSGFPFQAPSAGSILRPLRAPRAATSRHTPPVASGGPGQSSRRRTASFSAKTSSQSALAIAPKFDRMRRADRVPDRFPTRSAAPVDCQATA